MVDGKLPNENFIAKLSKEIVRKNRGFKTYFICFYLPDMKLDAGAFATGHHNLKLKVRIHNFILADYPEYSKLL
ncbi:MAG: hypothetical protein KAS93_08225 [Gammaproteobacteria bacterium]|nr:hypothetical protein [Gammaproteobacteria bacterium]